MYCFHHTKEPLAQNKREIWELSGCSGTWTHNYLVCERTHNDLAKLAKWLSCVLSIYLHGALTVCFHQVKNEWVYNQANTEYDVIKTRSQYSLGFLFPRLKFVFSKYVIFIDALQIYAYPWAL